jgi:hypothetical protein
MGGRTRNTVGAFDGSGRVTANDGAAVGAEAEAIVVVFAIGGVGARVAHDTHEPATARSVAHRRILVVGRASRLFHEFVRTTLIPRFPPYTVCLSE